MNQRTKDASREAIPAEVRKITLADSRWPERWKSIRIVALGVFVVLLCFGVPTALLVWAISSCSLGLSAPQ